MPGVRHAFTSAVADGGNSALVQPSNWNAEHLGALDWFVLTDYGAVPDGTTDNHTAITAAITAVKSNGGGIIYAPITSDGLIYAYSGALAVDPSDPMSIIFMGQLGSSGFGETALGVVFKQEDANTHGLVFNDDANGSSIIGLAIHGPGPAGQTSGDGIRSSKTISTRNTHVRGFFNGMHLLGDAFYSKHWESMWAQCTNAGVFLEKTGVTGNHNAEFHGCRFQTSEFGLDVDTSWNLAVIGSSVEGCGTNGIRLNFARGFTLSSTYYENNGDADIRLGGNASRGGAITGNYFQTTTLSIDAHTSSDIFLAGNYLNNGKDRVQVDASNSSGWIVGPNFGSGSYGTFPADTRFLEDGLLSADKWEGVSITGTPTSGQVPVASSGTAAAWGDVGGTALTVEESDGSPSVGTATAIVFDASGFTVTDSGGGTATIANLAGGTALTVMESDGTPSVQPTNVLSFDGAAVTDPGGGTALVTISGSGLTIEDADASPQIAASTLVFENGTLVDEGAGVASYTAPTGGGGLTQAYAGYNTIGASTEDMSLGRHYMKPITLANDCLLTSIDAYVDAPSADTNTSLAACVQADNSGSPHYVIAYVPPVGDSFYLDTANPPRWVSLPCGIWLAAGDYWIGVVDWKSGGTLVLHFDASSGTDKHFTPSGITAIRDAVGGPSITDTTNAYSIRANTIR